MQVEDGGAVVGGGGERKQGRKLGENVFFGRFVELNL